MTIAVDRAVKHQIKQNKAAFAFAIAEQMRPRCICAFLSQFASSLTMFHMLPKGHVNGSLQY